jgi:hypothetical protein
MEREDFLKIKVKCSVPLSPAIEKYFTEYKDSIEKPNTKFFYAKESKTESEVLFFDDRFLHRIILTFDSIKTSSIPIKNIYSIEIETKSSLKFQKSNIYEVENCMFSVILNNQQSFSLMAVEKSFSEIIELKNRISEIIA